MICPNCGKEFDFPQYIIDDITHKGYKLSTIVIPSCPWCSKRLYYVRKIK